MYNFNLNYQENLFRYIRKTVLIYRHYYLHVKWVFNVNEFFHEYLLIEISIKFYLNEFLIIKISNGRPPSIRVENVRLRSVFSTVYIIIYCDLLLWPNFHITVRPGVKACLKLNNRCSNLCLAWPLSRGRT